MGYVCFVSSDIPEEWTQRWAGDFEVNPELHLPAENKFIGQYKQTHTFNNTDCLEGNFNSHENLLKCTIYYYVTTRS